MKSISFLDTLQILQRKTFPALWSNLSELTIIVQAFFYWLVEYFLVSLLCSLCLDYWLLCWFNDSIWKFLPFVIRLCNFLRFIVLIRMCITKVESNGGRGCWLWVVWLNLIAIILVACLTLLLFIVLRFKCLLKASFLMRDTACIRYYWNLNVLVWILSLILDVTLVGKHWSLLLVVIMRGLLGMFIISRMIIFLWFSLHLQESTLLLR
jgi:hypothetical protein